MDPKELFKNRRQILAQTQLRRAQTHCLHPQELNSDDLQNMSGSMQWCYDNKHWQMIIDFVICLREFFEQQGFWREGVYFTNLALKAADSVNNLSIRSQLFFNLGLFYDRQGLQTEAEQHYQSSDEMADKLGQTAILADAKHRLGWIAHNRRDYAQAKSLYNEAKSLRETLNPPDPLALSRSLHQLGILVQDMGEYEKAQNYYNEALALRKSQDNLYLVAASLHQLGALAVEQRDWEQAKKYFEEALGIRRKLRDRAGEAYALDQLGVIAQRQQFPDEARSHYLGSLKLKEELKDTTGSIRAKMHLGEVCLAQKRWDEARDWFESCLEDSRAQNEKYFEAQAHLQLGTLFYLIANPESAITHYKCSYNILKTLDGTWREQAGILYQFGLIAHNQGQLQAAHENYQTALEIQKQEGLHSETAMTHLQLGMIYQSCDLYQTARQHYEASQSTFEKEGPPYYLAQTIYRLGNIAELSGQPDQACIYYHQTASLCQQHDLEPMGGLAEALSRVEEQCISN